MVGFKPPKLYDGYGDNDSLEDDDGGGAVSIAGLTALPRLRRLELRGVMHPVKQDVDDDPFAVDAAE